MGFLDELRRQNNPIDPNGLPSFRDSGGGSAYFGQPSPNQGYDPNDVLIPAFDRVRNRNLSDHQITANFDSDLSLKHDFLRGRMTPESMGIPQNVVYQPSAAEQGAISPLDQAKLGLQKEQIKQTGRVADAELGLKDREFKLDQQKSDQIFGTKTADLERKVKDDERDNAIARERLAASEYNNDRTARQHQDTLESINARHAADLAHQQAILDETKRNHEAVTKNYRDALEKSGYKITDNPDGTQSVEMTRSGPGSTIRVIDPNGAHADWPVGQPLPSGYKKIGPDTDPNNPANKIPLKGATLPRSSSTKSGSDPLNIRH